MNGCFSAGLIFVLLTGCATTRGRPVSAPGELAYRITHPSTPRTIDLEILRVRDAPAAFTFTTPGAIDRVRAVIEGGTEVELVVPASGELDVPNDWVALRYRFSLDDVQRANGSADLTWGVARGTDLLVPGPAWLLRPRVAIPELTATISNEAMLALLPWEPRAENRWAVTSLELLASGFEAFGGRRCTLTVGKGTLEVAVLGEAHALGDEAICEWIRSSAAEVLQVRAQFPAARVAISVIPVVSNEASPFGRILPSNPRSLGFLIGTEARAEEFKTDTVALHELLHLAHPTFSPRETWLTEGFATYFTELARARSGRQSAGQAWEELLEGFDRASEIAEKMRMEEVIAEEGVGGRLTAASWTGAFFLLRLDLEIRKRTAGQRSLEDVFEALGTQSSLVEFGHKADAIAGAPIFDALKALRPFAAQTELLDALGVRRLERKVRLEPAPRAAERDALMRTKVRTNQ